MIAEPPPHDRRQPACRFAQGAMHPPAKPLLDRREFRTHPLSNTDSPDREPTMTSRLATQVREAEKVERLRSAVATPLSSFRREATEFQQPRFLFVQREPELGKACSQFFQTRRCVTSMLEAHHKVVRIADHDHVTATVISTPPYHPKVEHIVQKHVCQQR